MTPAEFADALSRLHDDRGPPCPCGRDDPPMDGCPSHSEQDCISYYCDDDLRVYARAVDSDARTRNHQGISFWQGEAGYPGAAVGDCGDESSEDPGDDADTGFAPDWRSPPGDTIRDLMRERGMDVDALARALGFSVGGVEDLLRGDLPICPRTAGALTRTIGGTAPFWTRRDEQYRKPREVDCAGPDATPNEETTK